MAKSIQQLSICSTVTVVFISIVVTCVVQSKLFLAKHQVSTPQAILVLGGGCHRELAAAQLAAEKTTLGIWVSSGLLPPQANKVFQTENISLSRVNLDYRATDTVTNFTTLVAQLQKRNIQHIYLITSDFHMPRATAIAFWILGSHGIAYTPVIVPSSQSPEPHHKILRDVARSWLWLLTGRTGSSLDPNPPVRSSQYQPINAARGCPIATQAPTASLQPPYQHTDHLIRGWP